MGALPPDLFRRGITGEGLDMICVDGGAGLLAALPMVLPRHPGAALLGAQKIRNILGKIKKADQPAAIRCGVGLSRCVLYR